MKSSDGTYFHLIGKVFGNGATTQPGYYSFIDRSVSQSLVFYKLIQFDFDGSETVYGPVSAMGCTGNIESDLLLLFSNTMHSDFLFTAPRDGKYLFRIFSNDGRLIFAQETYCTEGSNLLRAATGHLALSIYFAEVYNQNLRIAKRFMPGVNR